MEKKQCPYGRATLPLADPSSGDTDEAQRSQYHGGEDRVVR